MTRQDVLEGRFTSVWTKRKDASAMCKEIRKQTGIKPWISTRYHQDGTRDFEIRFITPRSYRIRKEAKRIRKELGYSIRASVHIADHKIKVTRHD